MEARKIVPVLALLGCLFLNTGVIRKDFDPIKNTQTDAISYKQKMEEIKDGEKGPPTPSYKFYEKQDFLVKTPMQTQSEEGLPPTGKAVPAVTAAETSDTESTAAPVPENEPASSGEDWWEEDQEDKASSGETPKDIKVPSGSGDAPAWEEKW